MSDQNQSICKYNQTGFYKFKEKCQQKKHEDQICEAQPQCTNREGKKASKSVQKFLCKGRVQSQWKMCIFSSIPGQITTQIQWDCVGFNIKKSTWNWNIVRRSKET